ncbi:hypothetical protein XENOCAPTIV_017620, partial [Xenoophorus captivus]
LTENVSLKEAAAADLIKQTKANNKLGIQPSAVEQHDAPKDATRRSLFKDQDSVQHKCFSPVQQEAKSGAFIAQIQKYLNPAKRQRLSALHTRATLVRGLMS